MFKEQQDPGRWLALASLSRTSAGHWRSFTSAVGRSSVVGVLGNTILILCLNEKNASKFDGVYIFVHIQEVSTLAFGLLQ